MVEFPGSEEFRLLPLYEYKCPQCGTFEIIRKFSDAPLLTCPTCGKDVHKLASAPAIQFKGSGWYITDYARKTGSADSAEPSSSSKSGSKEAAASKEAPASKDTSSPAKTSSKEGSASGSSPSK
jgi:putative FmdB family regulatory protein